MIAIIMLLFVVVPILSLPITLIMYFFDKKSKGILYATLIGITLGIIVYYYIPFSNYDLYRHQLVVKQMMGRDIGYLIYYIKNSSLEFLPLVNMYVASRFNNPDLIQFWIVSLGYGILFYMLYDYRKISNVNTVVFIIITVFTIFGFNTLYFISGLWYYISIIIFSLAVYLEEIKKKNKILCYILYGVSVLFHNATFFAIAVLLIYRFMGSKLNFRTVVIAMAIFILPTLILELLNNWFNIKIFKSILDMYNAYLGNDRMFIYYRGRILIIEFTKLIVTIFAIIFQKEQSKTESINGFIVLLSICTLIMLPKSIVMIRFVMPIQFMGIVPLFDSLKKVTKKHFVFILFLMALDLFYVQYFYDRMYFQSFGNLFENRYYNNIFKIFEK